MSVHLSPEIVTLLARVGCSQDSMMGKGRLFLRHKKRIAALGPNVLACLVPDWDSFSCYEKIKALLNIRSIRLRFAPEAFSWDLAVLRDKENSKITFFSFKAGEKRISWLDKADLRRNFEIDSFFREHGVNTLPLILMDEEKGLARQSIMPQAFATHENNLTPLDSQLLVCAQENAVRDHQGTHYHLIDAVTASCDLQEAFSEALVTLDALCEGWRTLVPLTQVHGDLTRWNILRESANRAWLIDFDRAFRASVFYDFVYAWVAEGGYNRLQAQHATVNLAHALGFADRLPPDQTLKVAVALFILDNLVYLRQTQGQKGSYTYWLTQRAFSCLRDLKKEFIETN